MNQHLQDILHFIQQHESLSSEQRNAILKSLRDADKELEITAFKLDRTEKVKKTTAILLEETIAELEQKRKAVEAQNRELEIETALERVRSSALAIKQPADMLEVCKIISQQLTSLNIKEIRNVQTAIFYQDKGTYVNYEYYAKHDKLIITEVDYKNHPLQLAFANQMLQGEGKVFTHSLKGKELRDWYEHQKTTNQFADSYLANADSLNYHWHSLGPVALGLSTYLPLTEDESELFKRFVNVFELAYRRYLDIEKAEAQAREAQIEAALEKVRSRSLAMHKSDELQEVVHSVFERLKELHIELDTAIIIIFTENSRDAVWWLTNKINQQYPRVLVNYADFPYLRNLFEARENGSELFSKSYTIEEKNELFDYLFEHTDFKYTPEAQKKFLLESEILTASVALTKNIGIQISSYSQRSFSEKDNDLLKRFAKVFDQAYIRFLDLQKAEAQSRESQVQLALERVRARTMAMQKSDELSQTSYLLFEQWKGLGNEIDQISIGIFNEGETAMKLYSTLHGSQWKQAARIEFDKHVVYRQIFSAWKKKKKSFVADLSGKELRDLNKFKMEATDYQIRSKDELPQDRWVIYVAFFSNGMLSLATQEPQPKESVQLLERFATVFDLTYTRFLDLKNAEAQAREAQIQLALERVRARTMAMQKSDELLETSHVLFEQFKDLGEPADQLTIGVVKESENIVEVSATFQGNILQQTFRHGIDEPIVMSKIVKGWKAQKKSLVLEVKGKELEAYNQYRNELVGSEMFPTKIAPGSQRILQVAYFSKGMLALGTNEKRPQESLQLLERFASVFDLTYTRFLDLKNAEAQAREAKIEVALERVRSKAMAMHKSEDLNPAVATVFEELEKLNLGMLRCGIGILNKENRSVDAWITSKSEQGTTVQISGDEPMDIHPLLQAAFDAWMKQQDFSYVLQGEDMVRYYKATGMGNVRLPESQLILSGDELKQQHYHLATFQAGGLFAFRETEFPEEAKKVMKRFANVFDLTYKRFLDLQKAEAQAREAKIEAALERVRSKTMAMHNSQDVGDTVATMFDELVKLGIETFRCGIGIMHEKEQMEVWTAKPDATGRADLVVGKLDMNKHALLRGAYKGWKNKDEIFSYELEDDDLVDYFNFINNHSDYPVKYEISSLPSRIIHHDFYFPEGTLFVFSLEQLTVEATQVFKRFSGVFGQTYRRYLDLQRAEAQAREAQIEASLERVRARAMSMHSSEDLSKTVNIFFKELKTLGITPMRCGVGEVHDETHTSDLAFTTASNQGESYEIVGKLKLEGHPVIENIYKQWKLQAEYHPVLQGADIKAYYSVIKPQITFPDFPEYATHYGNYFYFNEGFVFAWAEKQLSEEEVKIFRRFTSVISLTYTRYMDLQKSESNAKEAVKQAALDRVRAVIASMRNVSDLEKITPLIWNELTILGIPFIRCGVFIMDDSQKLIHTFLSTPEGKAIAAFHLPYTTPGNIQQVLNHWHEKKTYMDHWDESAFTVFAATLEKQGSLDTPEQYLKTIPRGGFYLHFLPFLQGMLYVGNTTQLDEEEIKLIQSVADAFSTAYARYEDFNKLEAAKQQVDKTLVDLKQAQTQLVQSEKMASLGELTAGIAHEIQNPLNFVNNFSEVSSELLDEMKQELANGNGQSAIEIAGDVKQNLEKILHHGKRADAIVKGMLQHSRTSSGQKELTDINVLADEYLRLAYHGLRAKDKTFNAKFEAEFDKTIEKINVMPQDIGRAILNLINNAFYAVTEKKKQLQNGYEPTVTVATKKLADKIELRVIDNGNGIPQKVLDKIFQPFFTTKPTGQGTGLGLSLSYDIITKGHGGELKVETKEGQGSEFIIQLPCV